jgi:hypothetical protein
VFGSGWEMRVNILIRYASAAMALTLTLPAQAQLFWKSPDFSGLPLAGYEPGMGVPLPGATTAEQRAAIIWNMRSGLNVAALQCGFEPTLRTLENYNALLGNHNAELASAFSALEGYFKRTSKTVKAGQNALDTFGTRTYSGYSTVRAQLGFCQMAGKVGRIALFTPKGQFATFANEHLREMRNALIAQGEQQFRGVRLNTRFYLPRLDERCWKNRDYIRACGAVVG